MIRLSNRVTTTTTPQTISTEEPDGLDILLTSLANLASQRDEKQKLEKGSITSEELENLLVELVSSGHSSDSEDDE